MEANKRFKDFRQFAGLTQAGMAEKLDISRDAVAQIETNRMKVSGNIEARLAKNFTISDEFLLYVEAKRNIEELLKK